MTNEVIKGASALVSGFAAGFWEARKLMTAWVLIEDQEI
jgi:hypothetical protein